MFTIFRHAIKGDDERTPEEMLLEDEFMQGRPVWTWLGDLLTPIILFLAAFGLFFPLT